MDLRMLQSLQQAMPVLLRHLGAYLELAEQDMTATKAAAITQLRVISLLCFGAFFTILMSCMLVIAFTWDTENRVLAVGIMLGVFLGLTVGSGWYLANRRPSKPFDAVRREWRQDRELISRLLSGDESKARDENRDAQSASAY